MYLCNRKRENLRDVKKADVHILMTRWEIAMFYSMTNSLKIIKEKLVINRVKKVECTICQETQIAQFCHSRSTFRNCTLSWKTCQKPTTRCVTDKDVFWYDKVSLGINTLNSKMKTLSGDAGLPVIYTNHCLCATHITALDHAGFEATHTT